MTGFTGGSGESGSTGLTGLDRRFARRLDARNISSHRSLSPATNSSASSTSSSASGVALAFRMTPRHLRPQSARSNRFATDVAAARSGRVQGWKSTAYTGTHGFPASSRSTSALTSAAARSSIETRNMSPVLLSPASSRTRRPACRQYPHRSAACFSSTPSFSPRWYIAASSLQGDVFHPFNMSISCTLPASTVS